MEELLRCYKWMSLLPCSLNYLGMCATKSGEWCMSSPQSHHQRSVWMYPRTQQFCRRLM